MQGAGEPRVPGSEGAGTQRWIGHCFGLQGAHTAGDTESVTLHRGFPKCVGFAIGVKF